MFISIVVEFNYKLYAPKRLIVFDVSLKMTQLLMALRLGGATQELQM